MVKIFEHTEPQEYEYDGYNIRYDTWNGVWVIDGVESNSYNKTFDEYWQAEDFIDILPSKFSRNVVPAPNRTQSPVKKTTKKKKAKPNGEKTFPKSTTYKQIYNKYKDEERVVYILRTLDGEKFACNNTNGSNLCDFCEDDMLVFATHKDALNSLRYRKLSYEIVEAKIKNGDLYVL